MLDFKSVMESKGKEVSLKAIATVLGLPQQRIYGVAKQPIAGQVFDPHVYNWGAISKLIEKRIGKEGDQFQTVEAVYDAALAADDSFATSDKRRGPHGASKAEIDLGNGEKMPARRKEIHLDDEIFLKGRKDTLKVVYFTDTHVVLNSVGTTSLTCLSNWTFNQKVTSAPAVDEVAEDEPASTPAE